MIALARRRLLLQLALGLPLLARAERGLKVFGDDHYVPLSYLQQGRASGQLIELLQAAEPALALRFDIELLAWNRAMKFAEQGHGGLIGVSHTRARAAWLDFSAPLYQDHIHLVVRRDRGFTPQGLDGLAGRLIGIGNGVSYGEELEQALASRRLRVTRDWGIQRRLRIVLAGKVDGVFIGSGQAGYEAALRAEPELWARRGELLWLPEPMLRDRLHLAFPKRLQLTELLARFNAALAALKLLPN